MSSDGPLRDEDYRDENEERPDQTNDGDLNEMTMKTRATKRIKIMKHKIHPNSFSL